MPTRQEAFLAAFRQDGKTKPMTFTLTEESRAILKQLQRKTKNSKSGLIREALILLAKKHK
jgi:hypothetical protein